MAIKRKSESAAKPNLPEEFLERTKRAFSFQAITGQYKDAFDEEKAWVEAYLEKTTEIQVEVGKGLRTPEGLVCMKSRDNWEIDKDELERMVKTGEMSLATLIAISSVNAKKLSDSIGEARFAKIAKNVPSEHLAMTATPEFKREIAEKFNVRPMEPAVTPDTPASPAMRELVAADDPVSKPVSKFSKTKPAAAEAPSATSSLERAKASAARAAAMAKPTDDLDAILKGK